MNDGGLPYNSGLTMTSCRQKTIVFPLAAVALCSTLALSGCRGSGTPTSPTGSSDPPPATSACAFAVQVSGAPFNAVGGSGSVSVTTESGCRWTVDIGANSWIGLPGKAPFVGSVTFPITVGPNRTFSSRSALLAVVHESGARAASLSVTQRGAGCLYSVDPPAPTLPWWGTFPPGETSILPIAIHAEPAGCSWTATPTVPWIEVAYRGPLSGTGDATLTFFVHPYTASQRLRTGEIVVAGLSGVNPDARVVVTQNAR
jgi:hypothetical protein